jgi:hypothetical protein
LPAASAAFARRPLLPPLRDEDDRFDEVPFFDFDLVVAI